MLRYHHKQQACTGSPWLHAALFSSFVLFCLRHQHAFPLLLDCFVSGPNQPSALIFILNAEQNSLWSSLCKPWDHSCLPTSEM